MVDRVAKRLVRGLSGRPIGRSRTGELPLPGGSTPPEILAAAAAANDGHGVARDVIDHLAGRYGSRLDAVLGVVAKDRALGAPVLPDQPDPQAEVVSAVDDELAVTLEDVLRRRTQLALFDPAGGTAAADAVAALMAERLGWSPEDARDAARAYVDAVREDQRRWR